MLPGKLRVTNVTRGKNRLFENKLTGLFSVYIESHSFTVFRIMFLTVSARNLKSICKLI